MCKSSSTPACFFRFCPFTSQHLKLWNLIRCIGFGTKTWWNVRRKFQNWGLLGCGSSHLWHLLCNVLRWLRVTCGCWYVWKVGYQASICLGSTFFWIASSMMSWANFVQHISLKSILEMQNVMKMIHQQPVEFGSESHDLPVRIIPNRWKVVSRLCPYMQPLQKQVCFLCVIKKQHVYKYKT